MEKQIISLDVVKVFTSDKKKDGTPITDFNGRPARKVSIRTEQYPAKYLYSFPSSKQDDPIFFISERSTIQAIVWENNGFMNFKLPTRLDLLEVRVKELEDAVFETEKTETKPAPKEENEDLPDF